MKRLANVLWLIFGGLLLSFCWAIVGFILCITIVGIPFGMQCFKFASLMIAPFGKKINYSNHTTSFFMNILWLLKFGWQLSLISIMIGIFWYITIIGIPIGSQCIKFAKLSLIPFGAEFKQIN